MDNNKKRGIEAHKKIVCLGGGTGTANLMRGLQAYEEDITAIVSMADDGGSGGRLRRLYNIPMGDMVACLTSLAPTSNQLLHPLLLHRLPGDRYGSDNDLGGHKIGNLILTSLTQITGSFEQAIKEFQILFSIRGTLLPATKDAVTISAVTSDSKEIIGEESIDLGKYEGEHKIDKVFLHPHTARASEGVVEAIMNADVVVCGPGDLYTTLLPVLVVEEISAALQKTKAKRCFVVNIANKPFETNNYHVGDFITAVEKHLGCFPFDYVIVNNKINWKIPPKYHYEYVPYDAKQLPGRVVLIEQDLVDEAFPLYHDSDKLAKVVLNHI